MRVTVVVYQCDFIMFHMRKIVYFVTVIIGAHIFLSEGVPLVRLFQLI